MSGDSPSTNGTLMGLERKEVPDREESRGLTQPSSPVPPSGALSLSPRPQRRPSDVPYPVETCCRWPSPGAQTPRGQALGGGPGRPDHAERIRSAVLLYALQTPLVWQHISHRQFLLQEAHHTQEVP